MVQRQKSNIRIGRQTPEEQRGKKERQSLSNVKAMLTIFFDQESTVHHEYAPRDQTAKKEYYLEVLYRLHDAMRRKWPDLWRSGDWMLYPVNAPAHSSHLIHKFLIKQDIV